VDARHYTYTQLPPSLQFIAGPTDDLGRLLMPRDSYQKLTLLTYLIGPGQLLTN